MTTPTLSSIANPGNFLRTTRHFPQDPQELSVELNKMYTEAATQINNRISALHGTKTTITGESWYLNGQKGRQQSLRQVYLFTGPGSIAHGINPSSISQFTKCWGEYLVGQNWYGLIFASNVTIAGQITFYVTATNIVVLSGAGAPSSTEGLIELEWLSVQ